VTARVWHDGAADVRERVERWVDGAASDVQVLASSDRRELVCLGRDGPAPLLVKRFRRTRTRWPRAGPARREWRHLRRLAAGGVPVPRVRGLAGRGDDAILVLAYLAGRPLESLRELPVGARRRALAAVGRAVRAMHRAGVCHRDLHTGNVWLTAEGPLLLDFQRSRRTRSQRARLADLGALEFSLRHNGFAAGDRLAVRRAALGLPDAPSPLAGDDRDRLRAVARAAESRARAYYASRTRRASRPGRRFAPLAVGVERGLRDRRLEEAVVVEALRAHDAARRAEGGAGPGVDVFKRDHRSCIAAVATGGPAVVVKEVVKSGWLRRLADAVRGSPARRAWRAGHGLACRGVRCARPLAFVEERRFGLPVRSRLVLEDLRSHPVASDPAVWRAPALADRALDALERLVRALQRHGVSHGDLQALHVHLDGPRDGTGRLEPVLIDLEAVRFHRRLEDRQRIRALAELNASLPDGWIAPALRRGVFDRCARALPFRDEPDRVLAEVVRESLARNHHWRGDDCGVGASG
jgi:tRNA A-37 threonylcarbamoyl transferase component Bud32